MSKSEKRYFKIHAGVHTIGEENVYMKLFDIIDGMKDYDEESINKKFKGEKFIKNLFSAKKYLFDLILKILVSFKQEGNLDMKMQSMIAELDIIQEKGLYKLYKTRLQKLEKTAEENERYYIKALILERKAVYKLTQFYEGTADENIDKLRNEMIEVLDKIKYTYEYKMLYDKMFFLLKNADAKVSRGDTAFLEDFMADPLFKDESKAATPAAKYFYYTILAHYYYAINDHENGYKCRKSLINFMESDPKYMEIYPKSYLSALINIGSVCEKNQRYGELKTYSDKIKFYLHKWYGNVKDNRDTWAKAITVLCDIDITYVIKTCRFDDYDEVKRIIEDQDKYSDMYNEPRKIIVYNIAACFYFINKNYSEALKYLNKTLNHKDSRYEERIYIIAKLLNLVIHYEMGNYDLLEYTIKSTKSYLLKTNAMYGYEKLLIKFFMDVININDDKQLMQKFKALRDDLKKNSQYADFLDSFDLLSWTESKITQRDFKEILIEKRKLQLEKGIGD